MNTPTLIEIAKKLSGQKLQPYQQDIIKIIKCKVSVTQLPVRELPPYFTNSTLSKGTVDIFRAGNISVKNTRPTLMIIDDPLRGD